MSAALLRVLAAAEGAGRLSGIGVRRGQAEHPVCGDSVEIDVRVEDGRITDVAWRAQGCPASVAVTAVAAGAWRNVDLVRAEPALRERILALGGLAAHERHAERLVLAALRAAR